MRGAIERGEVRVVVSQCEALVEEWDDLIWDEPGLDGGRSRCEVVGRGQDGRAREQVGHAQDAPAKLVREVLRPHRRQPADLRLRFATTHAGRARGLVFDGFPR